MNLNECVLNRGKTAPKQNFFIRNKKSSPMGPPLNPPSRRKHSTPSSDLNWGKSHISVPNSSNQKSTSSKTSSAELEGKTLVAVTEGRGQARFEVGIAAINLSRPCVVLCQISDTQSYINALRKINIFDPYEILYPSTFEHLTAGNRLLDKLKQQFPNAKYTGVPRKLYNKTYGMERLQRLSIPSADAILLTLQHKYYALASASALLSYIQENLFIFYSSDSLQVEYQASEGYTIIDIATADRLELVCSAAEPAQAPRYSCLFDVVNRCQTRVGSRLLRSIILQPLFSLERIEERLELVGELINRPNMLHSVQSILQKIPSIEQLLTISTINAPDHSCAGNRQLNYVLLLNSIIEIIAPLKETLEMSNHLFFKNFASLLCSNDFNFIRDYIREMIQEEAYVAKGQNATWQQVFAIKPEINGLLDLIRKTYSERVEDMKEYVKMLAQKHDLPLTLANNNTKGYHIVLKLNKQEKKTMKRSDIPEEFIQVFRLAGTFTMKTIEMVNLSTRIDDIMVDLLQLSNTMIHGIIVKLKSYIGLFYQLCDAIAYLDVLQSLAVASFANGYIRPKFRNYTEVMAARHPMLDFLCESTPVSNSISSSQDFNINIITGPNGSGKSIFIRQVMLIQIMAQIGCYVPAETATFRLADRMFARIYLNDDVEWGASTFILEMMEVQYILDTMTNDSLIIIDELCRSTAVEQGTALAMGICERLSQTAAFTYITSHYTLLTKLQDICLNVKIWQMETIPSGEDPKTFNLDYKFILLPGVTLVKDYGLYLVRNIWPDNVMAHIDSAFEDIRRSEQPQAAKFVSIDEQMRLKYTLEATLRLLKDQKKLTIAEIHKHLNEYKSQLKSLGDVELESFNPENIDLENLSINHGIFDSSLTHYVTKLQATENTTADPRAYEYEQHASIYDSSARSNKNLDNSNIWIPEVQLGDESQNISLLMESNNYQCASAYNNAYVQDDIRVSQMSDSALSMHVKLTDGDYHFGKMQAVETNMGFKPFPPTTPLQLNAENATLIFNSNSSSRNINYRTYNLNNLPLERNVVSRSGSEISDIINAFPLPLDQSTPISRVYTPQPNNSPASVKSFHIGLISKTSKSEEDLDEETDVFSKCCDEENEIFENANSQFKPSFPDHSLSQPSKNDHSEVYTKDKENLLELKLTDLQDRSNKKEGNAHPLLNNISDVSNEFAKDPFKANEIVSCNTIGIENSENLAAVRLTSDNILTKIHPLSPLVIIQNPPNTDYSLSVHDSCLLCDDYNKSDNGKICKTTPHFIEKLSFDEEPIMNSDSESGVLSTQNPSLKSGHTENEKKDVINGLDSPAWKIPRASQEDLFSTSESSISYSPPNISKINISNDIHRESIEGGPTKQELLEKLISDDVTSRSNAQENSLNQDLKVVNSSDVIKEPKLLTSTAGYLSENPVINIIQNIILNKNMQRVTEYDSKSDELQQICKSDKKSEEENGKNRKHLKNNDNNIRSDSSQNYDTCLDRTLEESGIQASNKNTDVSSVDLEEQDLKIKKGIDVKRNHGPKMVIPKNRRYLGHKSGTLKSVRDLETSYQSTKLKNTNSGENNETSLKHRSLECNNSNDSIRKEPKWLPKESCCLKFKAINLKPLRDATSSVHSFSVKNNVSPENIFPSKSNLVPTRSPTTSISDASRKRNLDKLTTTSSAEESTISGSNNVQKKQSGTFKTSSLKESDGDEPIQKRTKKTKKAFGIRRHNKKDNESSTTDKDAKQNKKIFVPPYRKLTRNEIKQEFFEQDRQLLEMADITGS